MTIDELKREAMQLDPGGRAHLAHELLDSLDSLTEVEVEQLWLEEAARREAELDTGTAVTTEASEVLRQARARRG
jgi:Putative addiction module component